MNREWFDKRRILWTALSSDGATFADIGRAYDVTRERVRQVVRVSARSQGRYRDGGYLDPPRLLREICGDTNLTSLDKAARRARSNLRSAQRILAALGLSEAVRRLFRLRRRRRIERQRDSLRQQDIVAARDLALQLRRSPTILELRAWGVSFGTGRHHRWRSSNELLRSAGLPPRPRGFTGHLG